MSIGLAVHNGEAYLRAAIDSILAQTFRDFELIISDNASTDATEEICREYAAQDPRIRYHRNSSNIGGANNENQTFRMAAGPYFRWAAHDDVLAPTLLERCVAVLDRQPDVVLCFPRTIVIDAGGHEIERRARNRSAHAGPAGRFMALTDVMSDCEETYGLMRSAALARTGLQRNYTDSDRTLLAHLSLLGRFVEIDEYLFYKRVHPDASTQAFANWRERMHWFGDVNADRITLPFWSQWLHYFSIVLRTPLEPRVRIRCLLHLLAWPAYYRRWRSLGKDLVLAALAIGAQVRQRISRVSR